MIRFEFAIEGGKGLNVNFFTYMGKGLRMNAGRTKDLLGRFSNVNQNKIKTYNDSNSTIYLFIMEIITFLYYRNVKITIVILLLRLIILLKISFLYIIITTRYSFDIIIFNIYLNV